MSGIFSRLFGSKTNEKRDIQVVFEAMRSNSAAVEGYVSPDSALRMAAVFACVRIISETIASVPLHWYERLSNGKQSAPDFYLASLFRDGPNPDMTGFDYIETISSHLELWGHSYSVIAYDQRNGQIMELHPRHPATLQQTQNRSGIRYFQFLEDDGSLKWYSEGQIWHIAGFMGLSPIGMARRAVRLGMNAELYGSKFFENDARPGIVLEHPATLGDAAYNNLKSSWEEEHSGAANAHKPMILEEGMKLHEIGIPPQDAQFLETRKFQIQEIARIYRVPPHMLADLDRATFSNIEEQSIEFVKYAILPRVNRIERSILKFLEMEDEKARYYPEFLIAGLERGNIQSRYQAYATARQNGWMSANDIRSLENMNPIDGGDIYLVNGNMVPADQAGQTVNGGANGTGA